MLVEATSGRTRRDCVHPIEIAIRHERVFKKPTARADERSCECRQYAGEARGVSSIDASRGRRQLASEHRRCESAGWRDDHRIALTAQGQIQVDVDCGENRPTWKARASAPEAFTEVFLALVPRNLLNQILRRNERDGPDHAFLRAGLIGGCENSLGVRWLPRRARRTCAVLQLN
jgi:hypothetical protein